MTLQKKATVVATATGASLAIVKFAIGLMSGSVALLASAIDSLLDMLISLFNFFAIKKSEENPNDEFQYGKGKIQAIAGVIEGSVITTSGLYIIYQAIDKVIHKSTTTLLTPSILVMIFSIIVTFSLVQYLNFVAKKTNSLVIKSDALHYKTDLWSNGVILLALVLVYFTKLDIIDALFGCAIGIYIIYSAYEIIKEGILILLDRALDEEIIEKIHKIIGSSNEVTSYHWLKTRTDGTIYFVEFHLVLTPNMTLLEAHRIADKLEAKMMAIDENKTWLITPHFDPYDDEDINNLLLYKD